MTGRRVLITGGARGIGAALAERLAARGARLALLDLDAEALEATAARCGPDTFTVCCDVSDPEAVTAAIDAAAAVLGGLDVVVANAGIATAGPLRLQDRRSWERVIEINLLGVMYTDRAALPHLEASRGYLLNVASSAAALRAAGMTAYCAAKAGVEALSDALRIETHSYGVAVGVAYFLFLDTDMVRDAERELPALQEVRAAMPSPLGRTYPLGPAVEQLVLAIEQRRRRVAYPTWFLRLLPLRQLFAAPLLERLSARRAAPAMAAHERAVAERGAAAAGAGRRTRQLADL